MYLRENPVLQRELLVNLRMPRAFLLMLIYQGLLGLLVYLAWPQEARLNLQESPEATRQLIDLFFLGQFILAAMMAPSFASGAITGEKERKTYEMLLASPLLPESIILGKIIASLTHLGLLVFTSLPIVMLCLPLGGVSLYEVLAAYVAMLLCVLSFGMISLACSSYFGRTSASLVVSYLLILPLAITAVAAWWSLSSQGALRLNLILVVLPAIAIVLCCLLFYTTSGRMLHPPDVGSEGKEVVDLEEENRKAVGLVINREKFPDRLFAPPKRNDLMRDGQNPVLDKELHAEIFSQGTLMLRLVIQISMMLSIPMMAWALFFFPSQSYWYVGYVILFNILVGPVFSAGSVTSERERQTLDLLLTTNISPWKILWGKLVSGLRVSSVLTLFLTWPLLIAVVLVSTYWTNLAAVIAFFLIIAATCLTTSVIALLCSTLFNKSSHAMLASYLFILLIFMGPLATHAFAFQFFPGSDALSWTETALTSSPFAAAYEVPFYDSEVAPSQRRWIPAPVSESVLFGYQFGDWAKFNAYLAWTVALASSLMGIMLWLFRNRWRVSESGQ
jgi:ABC-type transport system involved in multi-copper enzyme maturation permease subunit